MATTQFTDETVSDVQQRPRYDNQVPGSYFGTDGAGFEHYFVMGAQRMRVTDGDEVRTFRIPHDKDLVDWAIQTVEQHKAYWADVRLDPPQHLWLEGAVPVGEFREVRANG